jgi:hypothetical protein
MAPGFGLRQRKKADLSARIFVTVAALAAVDEVHEAQKVATIWPQ